MPTSVYMGPGKWADLHFRRKIAFENGSRWYHVYVGEEAWGQVMSSTRGRYGSTGGFNREEWTALSFHEKFSDPGGPTLMDHERPLPDPQATSMVQGFATRRAAATYIVKTYGYWRNN